MKTKPILLATSPTLDGITSMIRKYFFGTTHKVIESADHSQPMTITKGEGITVSGHQVRFVKGRYRFECLSA